MTAFLDTNVLVRYVTADPPEQARSAIGVIEGDRPLVVSTVALAEAGYVLTSLYRIPRADAVDVLVELLERPNLSVHELPTAAAIEALLLCRSSGRVSFADALIWATARTTPERRVITFDQRFPDVDIERELLA